LIANTYDQSTIIFNEIQINEADQKVSELTAEQGSFLLVNARKLKYFHVFERSNPSKYKMIKLQRDVIFMHVFIDAEASARE
jgi:hypothetical protein